MEAKVIFFKAVHTRFLEVMFTVYQVVSCMQADGECGSSWSAGLQIHVRQRFGILQFKTPAIFWFLYVDC
jgi:hypothetical protein